MSKQIGRYVFDGPYASADALQDRSGVYAVLDSVKVVDIGESATVKTRVASHDRTLSWYAHAIGNICYAAYYTPNLQADGRCRIEQELRAQYKPPCGDR